MTILFTALVLAGVPGPAAAQPAAPAMHAQHAQQGQQGQHAMHAQQSAPGAAVPGEHCPCCKQMAQGAKMDCCAMHGQSSGAGHSGHNVKN